MEGQEKTKKKGGIIALIAIVIIALVAGGTYLVVDKLSDKEDGKISTDKGTIPMGEASKYQLTGNGLENFDLYFLQLENQSVNKIYSPLSIKYALAMLSEGAKGDSKTQIDNIIGEYHANKYVNSTNMSFANAMFIKNSYKSSVNSDYTNTLASKYNAEVIYDSFSKPDVLNNWVSDKTFDLINNLFDDISDQDFILVNALAIDMQWKKNIQADAEHYEDKFSVSYHHEDFFTYVPVLSDNDYSTIEFNNNGKETKTVEIGAAINKYDIVNTLGEDNIRKEVGAEYEKWLAEGICGDNQPDVNTYLNTYIEELDSNYQKLEVSTDFTFYDDSEVKVFAKELKEYNGTTLQYIGVMPKKNNLVNYIKNIDAEKLNEVIGKLKKVELSNFKDGVITVIKGNIPIFEFEYELKLMEDLKKLGITDVFNANKADLSGLTSDKNAFINKATHKANIEFSNEGIKAAAVTTMGGLGAAGCEFEYLYEVPVETIDLTFDKPYLFLIRDIETGEVWFTGTVYEPLTK